MSLCWNERMGSFPYLLSSCTLIEAEKVKKIFEADEKFIIMTKGMGSDLDLENSLSSL